MGLSRFSFVWEGERVTAKDIEARIWPLLEPEAPRHGLELVAVEVTGTHRPTIRVFLDRPGGIDLDTVAQANAWVSAVLDEADPVPAAYTLELSSPGIERPLVRIEDFQRHVGEDVSLKTERKIDGRARFTGTIEQVDDETIVIAAEDDKKYRLPHSAIAKARLKVTIDL